ncbi:peptidoglycan D,D-transpeptidase FtsI family protein [Jatrophihabitans sp. YIM 134969]
MRKPLKLGPFERRTAVAFAFVMVALVVIAGRLVWLQAVDSKGLASAAAAQRTQTIALHAHRGTIYDRDGVPLAYTEDARDITADPSLISPTEKGKVADQLAPLLGVPWQTIYRELLGNGRYAVLARAVAPVVGQQIRALDLTGIFDQSTTVRQYPGKTTGANVIGLLQANGAGAAGIEQTYDDLLRGRDGSITYPNDGNGNPSPGGSTELVPAVNGGNVTLTLDQDLQYVVQQEIDAAVKASEARSGEVVVMSRTGQVLAMASNGTYDSSDNSTLDHVQGQLNPPVQQIFEPGSVNKIVTFSAALAQGLITPTTQLQVPDAIDTGGVTVHDAWWHPEQTFTATGVIAKSSNVGTLEIANKVGKSSFYDYMRAFGLGQLTGIGLPGESAGILPTPSQWSDSTFANMPIGQGVGMTLLQLAGMYQTLANDGVRIPPRIVQSTTDAAGAVTTTGTPEGQRVIPAQTAQTLRTMLEMVTQEGGTGKKAAIAGYRVAGKTGTAQQPVGPGGKYSDSVYWDTFAGMAPADDPQFVVAIMVDNPAHGLEGGDVAAPVFHAIADYELQHANIPPTGSQTAVVPLIIGQ